MAVWDESTRVTVGGVDLELPAVLVRRRNGPIDSAAAGVFEGHGLTVIVDQGPFADRLDSHIGRPEYREHVTPTGRVVSFRNPDNTRTTAIHVPASTPFTVVVTADDSVPEHVVSNIIDSTQPPT